MSNSKKSGGSSSTTPLLEEKHEEPKSQAESLPDQHGLTSPISTVPGRHGGAPQYSFNSDGSLMTNSETSVNGISKPVLLEIPSGFDVISCVVQFALHFGLAITVLTGHGLISDVDIAYPLGAIPPPFVSTSFQIISFSGAYSCLNAASGNIVSCFHVQFADGAGNVMGGRILTQMKAASTVTLVLAVSTQV
ncbi:AT-hook motif nuclear-localized protein 23-like [Daucus carota subsp. sativus]|uniref:AT-hook motif nuclear-localized protein 23-like n=1 Tax=Daucus carota subsp. sativus TaxID=79200 RepID=UPI003082D904